MRDAITQLEHELGGANAKDEMSTLLGLDKVGNPIVGARIVGPGLTASVELDLLDGTIVEFASIKEFGTPDSLALVLAVEAGASIPKLAKTTALRAVALLRDIAARTEATSIRDIAAGWGREFLWAAGEHPFELNDQASRYQALLELTSMDAVADARHDHGAVAAASIVLVDVTGARLVRTSWFRAHVRAQEPGVSPQQIAQRMVLVGWHRYGRTGKLHARRPIERTKGPAQILVPFYVVPPEWEANDAA